MIHPVICQAHSTQTQDSYFVLNNVHNELPLQTFKTDFFAWNDVHQKTNSLNRALALVAHCNEKKCAVEEINSQRELDKPSRVIFSFLFQSLMNFIKHCASLFPLFAASKISDSARSALCSIQQP